MNYSDKIILALDSSDIKENLSLINELVPPIKIVKIGPVSFLPNAKKLIEEIPKTDCTVMFDFKFFPIPSIFFNTSLACIPPTIFAVDPNIPSLSQFKNWSDGSVW